MAASRPRPPSSWSRRSMLAGGVLVGLSLVGCGLRLESDAPMAPLLPREPYPGLDELRAEREHCRRAGEAARALAASGGQRRAPTLVALHRVQVERLDARLAEVGGNEPDGPPGEPSTATRESSTPPTTAVLRNRLLEAEAAGTDPASVAALAAAPADDLALLGGIRVARTAAHRALGGPEPAPPPAAAVSETEAARLLALVRSAEYGVQIAAAQSAPARGSVATAARSHVSTMRSALTGLAGEQAAPPPLGYTLPFRVSTPGDADRLAHQVLTRFADHLTAAFPATHGHGDALAALFDWAAGIEWMRHAWGAPLRAASGS